MRYNIDSAVIGHFARDKIIVRGAETVTSGGSVYYGAMALARLGLSVAVVTRLAQADFPRLEELKEAGIRVYARAAEQTSGIENTYLTADMDRRQTRPLGFAGPFRLSDVPRIQARIWMVGPIMAGEVDLPFVRALSVRGPVALDAQGFVRVRAGDDLVFRDWPEKSAGLPHVQYLKVDSAEAEVLTGQTDLLEAARRLAGWGPREIVLTHARGVLVYADGALHEASFTPRSLEGRTGRGDTCFAAYLARRLSATPEEACLFAAQVTSIKMERAGAFRGFEPGGRAEIGDAPALPTNHP
jgi:sugar/nucleoside kinase (ribokinase family)